MNRLTKNISDKQTYCGYEIKKCKYQQIYDFKKYAKDVFSIYMIPKDIERAKQELRNRNLPIEIEKKRLQEIDEHIEEYTTNENLRKQFNYVFINDYTEVAKNNLLEVIKRRLIQ